MGQNELLYDLNSGLISFALLLVMAVVFRLGRMSGKRSSRKYSDESKGQFSAVQASLLGLLALLLGFTFSLALNRYDDRSRAVVQEANAIGTAWLRTSLLGESARADARRLMLEYGTLRRDAGEIAASDTQRRDRIVAAAEDVFDAVWRIAADEARANGGPVAMGFVTSLNDMIDALGDRNAAIERHVPELVLMLMFATFVLLSGILGYNTGLTMTKSGFPIYAMLVLIVILVFVIIDLDRPRRGFIAVDQSAIAAIVETMSASQP